MNEDVKNAMTKIKKDDTLKNEFYEDPKKVLEKLGVNTENIKIKKIDTSKQVGPVKDTVCFNIGEIVGFSVG